MALQLSTEYEALKHDVNELFSRFCKHQSVRFEMFAKEWSAMNFSCIFAATFRNTAYAKKRVAERLLRVASEFLSSDSTFLYRVAAVYMLYSVYFKQIITPKLKIRMTPTMWKDLMEFLSVLVEHQHLDVAFIIQKLRKHDAFIFTAMPKELMFGRHEFMLGIEEMTTLRMSYEADKYTTELLNNDFAESLTSIQNEYEKVKQKVFNESKPEEKPFLSKVLNYSNSGFGHEISQWITDYKTQRTSTQSVIPEESFENSQRPILSQLHDIRSYTKVPDNNVTPAETNSSVTRAEKIAKIKEKSFKTSVNKTPHKSSRVKNEETMESDEDSAKEENTDQIIYRRSAMLKPFKLKVPPRNPERTMGVRLKKQ